MSDYDKNEDEQYEYVKVTRDAEGNCKVSYKLKNNTQPGSDSLDDDVSEWTDGEIISVVSTMLDISADELSVIEIINE